MDMTRRLIEQTMYKAVIFIDLEIVTAALEGARVLRLNMKAQTIACHWIVRRDSAMTAHCH